MITANQRKHIQSLRQKKFRDLHGVFVAEGDKIVRDVLSGKLEVVMACGVPEWMEANRHKLHPDTIPLVVTPKELGRISHMRSPNQALAIVKKPAPEPPRTFRTDELVLVLDTIQDPGNLGTMLRAADWFGVRHVFCSPGTADVFNPKTIQASMGSFARISVHHADLLPLIGSLKQQLTVYGAFPDGQDVLASPPALPAALVIGNESQGISDQLVPEIPNRVVIPPYRHPKGTDRKPGQRDHGPESLNAAMASAVMMAAFRGFWGKPRK